MLTLIAICPMYALVYFVYADDNLFIALSVSSLQTLIIICETEILNINMSINPNKSVCIRFSPQFNAHCEHITSVSRVKFEWVDNFLYLGIFYDNGIVQMLF